MRALIIIVQILSLGLGYMAARLTEDDCICEEEDSVEISKDKPTQGIIKEIVYENKKGELFCPPPNRRRCVIVPRFLPKIAASTSCSEIEDKLLDIQEKYEDMKKFCDPACPEYLDRTSRELLSCMRDLQAVTGSYRYDESIYFP